MSVSDGGEEMVGSLPLQAVCGGTAGLWPCSSCCASQEEETNPWVLTSACSQGVTGERGHVQDVCVQVSRPRSAVDLENVGLESSFPARS